ncbi:MAG TPA: O-methyltransferase [Candidatus Thermoplasmatota archaeon]|nr:O-methyltransferase [Candidatus Thermoplasmatota archaeon]
MLDHPFDPYLRWLHGTPDPVQQAMEAEGARRGFPIIGPLVGRLCAALAAATGARKVFEMGSGFGYSTLHFARAVGPGGRVVHTEGDAGLSREAQEWMARAGVRKQVEFRLGDARDLLRADPGPYDIVFIDADKHQYPDCLALARQKVRVGGLILTDNTLWSGKVWDKAARDRDTDGVREYNRMAFSDPSLLSTLVPLRDGVAVSVRVA